MQTVVELQRIRTTELAEHGGETIRLHGWLHAIRRLGGITFVLLRDGWGVAQIVVESDDVLAPLNDRGCGPESVISVTGTVKASPPAPSGYELIAPTFEIISPVTQPPPITLSKREIKASLPTLLEHAVVANRHPARRAVFRLAAGLQRAFRSALEARGFTEIQTPKIVAAATESGANVFRIDYFHQPAFLAQSPQLYKQIMVGVFERVFEIGPVFRAEPHDTVRHVNEYVSLDAEMGFIADHFDVMRLLNQILVEMLTTLGRDYASELALLETELPHVPDTIPQISFVEAKELLYARYGEDTRHELDLSPQEERWLGEWAAEKHNSDFLFVTGYPMQKRPFYTHPDPENPAYSNSFDLLFRGTEMVTGGQRLHSYEQYLAALKRTGTPTEPFAAYLEAFQYGMPAHGGFGMGLERLVMQLTGLPNIRLATLFPRDINRLTP